MGIATNLQSRHPVSVVWSSVSDKAEQVWLWLDIRVTELHHAEVS